MRTNKIISAATAVMIFSLATACSFISDDSQPDAENEKRTPTVDQARATTNDLNATPDEIAASVPEDTTVFLLTGQDTGRRITNEDFEQLRKDMAKSKNSEEPQWTTRELTAGKKTPSEDQRWCQAWALDNLKPHVYAEFIKLDPQTMDDIDRTVWQTRINGNSPRWPATYDHDYRENASTDWSTIAGNCWMYWSEPLSTANADRRNYRYEAECYQQLMQRIDAQWDHLVLSAVQYENDGAYEIPNQYVKVLTWLDIPGSELLKMDEPPYELLKRLSDKSWAYNSNTPSLEIAELSDEHGRDFDTEWWNLVGSTLGHRNSPIEECPLYYPQLFYGYWVPLAEHSTEPPDQLSDEEAAKVKQVQEGPLYLPRP